jgi:hypothetical protein
VSERSSSIAAPVGRTAKLDAVDINSTILLLYVIALAGALFALNRSVRLRGERAAALLPDRERQYQMLLAAAERQARELKLPIGSSRLPLPSWSQGPS